MERFEILKRHQTHESIFYFNQSMVFVLERILQYIKETYGTMSQATLMQ